MQSEVIGRVRYLTGRDVEYREKTKPTALLHNAVIAWSAMEELHVGQVLDLVRSNKPKKPGAQLRRTELVDAGLVDEDGLLAPVLDSDGRLATNACLAVLTDDPNADDLIEELIERMEAPYSDPVIRGSSGSAAATHLVRWVWESCQQVADLLGFTAVLALAQKRTDRARKLVHVGDLILSAPMLVRHPSGVDNREVQLKIGECSTVDDLAQILGPEVRTRCTSRDRPKNSPDKAKHLLSYNVAQMGGLAAGLRGIDENVFVASLDGCGLRGLGAGDLLAPRVGTSAAFGTELRLLRESQHDSLECAAGEVRAAAKNAAGLEKVVTVVLRHSPERTRRVEHQVLVGLSHYQPPPGRPPTRPPTRPRFGLGHEVA
jgi:hypothetical protein